MPRMTITEVGGRIIEGRANGFKDHEIALLLGTTAGAIRQYSYRTNRDLGAKYSGDPSTLSVAKCIVASLLKPKDLKKPGELFTFTMQPTDDSKIGFRSTYERYVRGQQRQERQWPVIPLVDYEMSGARFQVLPEVTASALQRTLLSYFSVGLAVPHIIADGLADNPSSVTSQMIPLFNKLGAVSRQEAVAKAAFWKIIRLDPAILGPEPVAPTVYERGCTMPRPVFPPPEVVNVQI